MNKMIFMVVFGSMTAVAVMSTEDDCRYAEAYQECIDTNRSLCVWVGCEDIRMEKSLDDFLHLHVSSFPDAESGSVIVSKPEGKFLYWIGTLTSDNRSMKAVRNLNPGLRLVSQAMHEKMKRFLPSTTEDWLDSLFSNPNLIFYTEIEIPPIYQTGERTLRINPSDISNPNNQFPWKVAAGTHTVPESAGLNTVRFYLRPADGSKILWYRENGLFRWVYPEGATFGEILTQHLDGVDIPWKVRTRTKTNGFWIPQDYKPFRTPEELSDRLVSLYSRQEVLPVLMAMREIRGDRWTLTDSAQHPFRTVFHRELFDNELPDMKPAVVAQLLRSTPFKPSRGTGWMGKDAPEPTSHARFGIVPPEYTGAVTGIKACMQCHETTLHPAGLFAPQGTYDPATRIRGDDGIFSFHPVDPISIGGFPVPNHRMVRAGLLKEWK